MRRPRARVETLLTRCDKSHGPRVKVVNLTPRATRVTRKLRGCGERPLGTMRDDAKQNVTISLSRRLLKKAKILAARRETSISGLLANEIEVLVGEEEAYERAKSQAMALLDKGFRMGGVIRAGRDELHER